MEPIKLDCTYEERTSIKDTTKKYKAIYIKIAPNYEKVVFLTVPEQALLEQNNKSSSPYDFQLKKLVVWYIPGRDVYYHRYVKNWSSYCPYTKGYKNRYGHIIVHVIEPQFDYYEILQKKKPLTRRCVNKIIFFLNKYR